MSASAPQPGEGRPVDLVFEGGGVKGIGLAGAYWKLWDEGYRPACVAGTSAGAITAALVAAGYTGPELRDIVLAMKFKDFEDPSFFDRFGAPGDMLQFLTHRGIHSGDYFSDWMRKQLARKHKTKFGDLKDPNATDDKRRYGLQVIASDLSGRCMLVLPRDAAKLGVDDPDELDIADAVRMSMSIPVFFKPVVRKDDRGREHTIVDGGLLSNYPIWLFDAADGVIPRFPTFGMLLVAPDQAAPLVADPSSSGELPPVSSPVEFAKAIVETMMQAHDRFYVEQANYARTIPIPTLGVKTTQFDLSSVLAQRLFESGVQAATSFLQTWNFDAYIDRFRTGPSPTRRSTVLAPPA